MQTQAPVKRIYWSNGPTREFKVGNETVIVQHKSESKLKWLNRPEGELLRGLLSLSGKYARLEAIKMLLAVLISLPGKLARPLLRNW